VEYISPAETHIFAISDCSNIQNVSYFISRITFQTKVKAFKILARSRSLKNDETETFVRYVIFMLGHLPTTCRPITDARA